PQTKPSRSRSKGREASAGASFRVESAFIALNPAMQRGEIVDSAPPAIITSASPIEWFPVAQADTEERFGPFAPKRIEMWPGARFASSIGMKKGEIRPGP